MGPLAVIAKRATGLATGDRYRNRFMRAYIAAQVQPPVQSRRAF